MTKQTAEDDFAIQIADEVRGELARQRKTAAELAIKLGVSKHTVGSRLNGRTSFNLVEVSRAASFLGLSVQALILRASAPTQAEEVAS